MRAIIIDDKDAKSLRDRLQLLRLKEHYEFKDIPDQYLQKMHRIFNMEVVKWLQEQGASLT